MVILGHGVDLVSVQRIERMLDDHGRRFMDRCFTTAERDYAESGRLRRAERYASRFAAKEAVLKALGTGWRGGIAWTDIEVLRMPSGQPTIRLTGRCAQIADDQGMQQWWLSLSHIEQMAIASVIATGSP